MKHLLSITCLFLYLFSAAQVNDDAAFINGSYDKSYVKSRQIHSVNIEIVSKGNRLVRQHNFDSIGNLIYTSTSNEIGQKLNESHSKYNQFGDKISTSRVSLNRNTSDSTSYERVYLSNKLIKESSGKIGYSKEYYYNDLGQLVKITTTNDHGVTTSTLHRYDDAGKEIESVWMQNRSKKITKNIYDNQGSLIEFIETFYEPSDTVGKLFLHKRLLYNANGKIVKEEYLGGYFDFDKDTKEYFYDNSGNLVQYKTDKEILNFTYDINGYLSKKETRLNGMLNSVETYSYRLRQ